VKLPLLLISVAFAPLLESADLERFSQATLETDPANDGDSFLVQAGGERLHLRLYYVDCPETSHAFSSGLERLEEQARYFGLPNAARTLDFGNQAEEFTQRQLAKPFTVYTALADAPGGPDSRRRYAFVVTADGHDLARLLIENGWARVHGLGRETPDGTGRDEFLEGLRDLEASAMLKRVGLWRESDPEQIAKLRAAQRAEETRRKELLEEIRNRPSAKPLIDLNRATKKELESISGIGPVLADRIIAGRPYQRVDDLLRVSGIGPKTLAKLRPRLTVAEQK
jgi:endonuclease YncB( thermonuclease family)